MAYALVRLNVKRAAVPGRGMRMTCRQRRIPHDSMGYGCCGAVTGTVLASKRGFESRCGWEVCYDVDYSLRFSLVARCVLWLVPVSRGGRQGAEYGGPMNFWLEVAYCGIRVVTLFMLLLAWCCCVLAKRADAARMDACAE